MYIFKHTCIYSFDKSLLISGYTLTTSSDKATVGLDFTFTCVTTGTAITFTRDADTVCVITGRNTDGTCAFAGSYIADYTYTCSPTTNTYTVSIPGSDMTESLRGTAWRCQHPFGEGTASATKIIYVNGELYFIFLLLCNYNSCKYYNSSGRVYVFVVIYMVFCIRHMQQFRHEAK
jgi:hypothetical protein